jgi:hypothetical protein
MRNRNRGAFDDQGYGPEHSSRGRYRRELERDPHGYSEIPTTFGGPPRERERFERATPFLEYDDSGRTARDDAGRRGSGQPFSRGGSAGREWRNEESPRSDAAIGDEVVRRLTDHEALDASAIEVVVDEGEVTLKGEVADRRAKRLAEWVVEGCRGVRDVHNRLKLRS